LDEDGYSTADYQDVARKRFIKAWEVLADGYKVRLTYNPIDLYNGLLIYQLGCIVRWKLPPVHRARIGCSVAAMGKVRHGFEIY
jgi:hypothetical protein